MIQVTYHSFQKKTKQKLLWEESVFLQIKIMKQKTKHFIQAHGAGGKNNVIIRAGGASRLTVTNDGNVGIGTTDTGANLDVKHPKFLLMQSSI